MKKPLKGLIGATLAALSLVSIQEKVSALSISGETIIIIQRPPTSEAPRTPVSNPFFAEVLDGYVLLGATIPCGTVSVSISSTAGDDYSTNFDTGDGTIVLPISGCTGYYTLLITTAAGYQFIGEFSI